MIPDVHPIVQTLLGTLLTWGLTALGAAFVIVFSEKQRKLLDVSLGFAAGVMTAASYWSLLAPAIEMAEKSTVYGENGEFAFVPATIGFLFGALFVWLTDVFITMYGLSSPSLLLAYQEGNSKKYDCNNSHNNDIEQYCYDDSVNDGQYTTSTSSNMTGSSRKRQVHEKNSSCIDNGRLHSRSSNDDDNKLSMDAVEQQHWKRMLMLIIAITVHNIPEGLAVGVGFSAIGTSPSATFQNARNLAVGIGIQNFPEGLAVSLPLRAAGFSVWRSFWYGQLSGMVEPIAGLLGTVLVSFMEPSLPYALAFAAGAMIYVVIDDIVPEANSNGNGKLATWGCIVGFLVMMILDVGLG